MPRRVPTTVTCADARGAPFAESTMVPRTVPVVWACAPENATMESVRPTARMHGRSGCNRMLIVAFRCDERWGLLTELLTYEARNHPQQIGRATCREKRYVWEVDGVGNL